MSVLDYCYESELYPIYHEPSDFDWHKNGMLNLPSDELQIKMQELSSELEELRQQEPAKKRGTKNDYRLWIMRTHDLRDLLNDMEIELMSRNNTDSDR